MKYFRTVLIQTLLYDARSEVETEKVILNPHEPSLIP